MPADRAEGQTDGRQDGSSNSQLESAPATDAPDILALKGNGGGEGIGRLQTRRGGEGRKYEERRPTDGRDVSLIQIDLLGVTAKRTSYQGKANNTK